MTTPTPSHPDARPLMAKDEDWMPLEDVPAYIEALFDELARVRTELACSKGAAAGLREALERAESELSTLRAELSLRKDWISPETYALTLQAARVDPAK
jgi:hypothetical protein